ncbi:MAG: FHA domain-containing protein [Burkholderiales bacterium]
MAKLILSLDGEVLREYGIDKESLTIGRKSHNDIQIDSLAVSSEHAMITTILNDSFLEDLDSTNGTLVNGNPVKKHYLQNGDVIEVGKHTLTYVNADAVPGHKAEDFEKTMILRASPLAAAPPASKPETPQGSGETLPRLLPGEPSASVSNPAPAGPSAAVLQILTGGNAGKELELTKTLTSLGKPGVQVAVITRRPQGYFITHVLGDDFPLLNGNALDAQAKQLSDHDVIDLAGVKMEFFFK